MRKCHPQPNEAHTHKIEELRDCPVRGCSFCAGVCSGICAGEMRRAMIIVPCGSAEKLAVKGDCGSGGHVRVWGGESGAAYADLGAYFTATR